MCPFDAEGGIQVVERARAQFGDAVGLTEAGKLDERPRFSRAKWRICHDGDTEPLTASRSAWGAVTSH
jgi:hypothetical protein